MNIAIKHVAASALAESEDETVAADLFIVGGGAGAQVSGWLAWRAGGRVGGWVGGWIVGWVVGLLGLCVCVCVCVCVSWLLGG